MSLYPENIGTTLEKNSFDYSLVEHIKNRLNEKKTIIRIYGFAGTGKGTLSKELAKYLDIPNIDSGLFWRAITSIYEDLKLDISPDNSSVVFNLLEVYPDEKGSLTLKYKDHVFSRSDLKNPFIDSKVALYASSDYNREKYYDKLIAYLSLLNQSCILDGRGAYPRYISESEKNGFQIIRILVDCEDEIKAKRYYSAYINKEKQKNPDFVQNQEEKVQMIEDLQKGILDRNQKDAQTWISLDMGMITADSAILDTSYLTESESTDLALNFIKERVD